MANDVASLVVEAPAKVNLYLRIVGKRSDGYHDLDTVMQKLDLSDTVTLSRTEEPGIRLSCIGADLPEDDSNLVWQAAEAFLARTGLAGVCGVSILLEKRIPVAAGLGGGSSDAASVLNGLNTLFETGLSEDTLLALARQLGADVPFFVVAERAVRATGIGDRMQSWPGLVECSLLLVNPGFSVSTAWVYKNFTLTRVDKDSKLSDFRKNETDIAEYCPLFNDLETVTIAKYPELERIKQQMLDCGASGVLMSGSGPTVFGVFPDQPGSTENAAADCAHSFAEEYDQGVIVTRPAVESYS